MIDTLAGIVGAQNLSTDVASRALAGSDLFPSADRVLPELVVRPATTEEVAAVARSVSRTNNVLVPRGAGLSYTGGVVPQAPSIVLDLTRLDHVRIEPDDRYAIVGAGCTWEHLANDLRPHGLRVAQSNPISGCYSTVGGAASQNTPGSMDGFLGLCVVLADGTIVRTGSWALIGENPFYRNTGPDLTGLFLGDCGVFGVKTEVALRLQPEPAYAVASFAFDRSTDLLSAMLAVQRSGLVTRCFAMDRGRGLSAAAVETGEALRTAATVAARAGSLRAMVADIAGLTRARADIADAAWSLHLTVEAMTEHAAGSLMDAARKICAAPAREIPPAIPTALRARPYSVRGFIGPDGERWVPVHGLCPLSRAAAAMVEMDAAVQAHSHELTAVGVQLSWLISSQGSYVLFEPMFYWPDALEPIHMQYLSERNRRRFGAFARNDAGRTLVATMRETLRDILDRHGAVHMQIGRYYRFAEATDAGSRDLLQRIKRALDPGGRMNSGALGL